MDKEVFDKFLNTEIRIVKDDGFVISGRITTIYDNSIAFFTDGKTIYMNFDRVKEILPLGGCNDTY